ncbi:hypothetical protein K4E_25090 [Enterococcus thailandicus]|nr:hypothetical protein K4E_25090 [Enterococcus thailandicus]
MKQATIITEQKLRLLIYHTSIGIARILEHLFKKTPFFSQFPP